MPWLATFAEKDESGADLLLRVVALGGEDRGRQFVLSMKEGEPREVSRLDEDQVEEQMSRPHLGGLAEDAPAGTSE